MNITKIHENNKVMHKKARKLAKRMHLVQYGRRKAPPVRGTARAKRRGH